MKYLAALALALSCAPALAAPRDTALTLYRATIAAERDFSNGYPAGMPQMRDARAGLEGALADHEKAITRSFADCASAASTLVTATGLMQARNLTAAETSARDYYTWRRGCERALKVGPYERPLQKTLELYRKP